MLCAYYLCKNKKFRSVVNEGIQFFFLLLQCVCRLSLTWYSLYVDWLYHMLWKLCWYGNWMWLLRRCWWSRATIIIYNGFDCSGTFYCDWDILQRVGGYNGWTANLATSLSHTCEKDANKGEYRWPVSCFSSFFLYLLIDSITVNGALSSSYSCI